MDALIKAIRRAIEVERTSHPQHDSQRPELWLYRQGYQAALQDVLNDLAEIEKEFNNGKSK